MAGAAERFEDKLDNAFLPFFGACRQSRKGFCGRRLGSEELGQSNNPRDRDIHLQMTEIQETTNNAVAVIDQISETDTEVEHISARSRNPSDNKATR